MLGGDVLYFLVFSLVQYYSQSTKVLTIQRNVLTVCTD